MTTIEATVSHIETRIQQILLFFGIFRRFRQSFFEFSNFPQTSLRLSNAFFHFSALPPPSIPQQLSSKLQLIHNLHFDELIISIKRLQNSISPLESSLNLILIGSVRFICCPSKPFPPLQRSNPPAVRHRKSFLDFPRKLSTAI
jgi:hypothetical protein